MAASVSRPGGPKVLSSESSSDSDDEEYKKIRAAAIDVSNIDGTLKNSKVTSSHVGKKSEMQKSQRPSLRETPKTGGEEHYFNTTPEFKSHVSKKLSQLIDGQLDTATNLTTQAQDCEDSIDTFQLFTDSVPGSSHTVETASSSRRRRKISSSDSDSENERLSAAAVSTDFILSGSFIHNNTDNKKTSVLQETSNEQGVVDQSSACKDSDNMNVTHDQSVDSSKADDNNLKTSKKKKKKHKKNKE